MSRERVMTSQADEILAMAAAQTDPAKAEWLLELALESEAIEAKYEGAGK
jgi:hypothetical protein